MNGRSDVMGGALGGTERAGCVHEWSHSRLTGLRKKMMEETITTTRFTQLPTEWVTGVTRWSTR